MLGGPDASVILGGVELVTRQVDGRSELAAFAQSASAVDDALAAIEGLEISLDDRAAALAAFRRALIATRDRWPALEREFPEPALAELHVAHPRAVRLLGHTIDPRTGGLHSAYAAARRGRKALFTWWSVRGGFYVPVTAAPSTTRQEATSSVSPCDFLDVGTCDVPCDLLDLLSVADCDPGCL